MNSNYQDKIATKLKIQSRQVLAVQELLADGSTVPFIARYRKEITGSLDEVAITKIRDETIRMIELDKRREAVIKSITEQGKMTPELLQKIQAAEAMSTLEDLYLPFKPKKRTKATVAKEKGLEPLAQLIYKQDNTNPNSEAQKYINKKKGVETVEDALQGARDIIAEWVSEDAATRKMLRSYFWENADISSKVNERKAKSKQTTLSEASAEDVHKYRDYFDWSEPLKLIPSHRYLAIVRGEKAGFLKVTIAPAADPAITQIQRLHVKNSSQSARQVRVACMDAYERLLQPSLESEMHQMAKEKADAVAIQVFADNIRELLLAPPLGNKRVLGVDPGFRTGCKVVVLNEQGALLEYKQIFPMESAVAAAKDLKGMIDTYKIQAIAIGNGTASRETEEFVRKLGLGSSIQIVMVNESGASIYSASEVAREEFPDKDVTVRGAVSIGRRLMDPLAELVKIDPKSVGVGQYQHDVDQTKLKASLDDVVMSAVNRVGVDVNTASKQILTYVSGLGPQLAANIIKYRSEHGAFKSRSEVKKVEKMGPKKYEQAAGFLRIRGARNPLDASAVHPESYAIVEKMAKDLGVTVKDLMANADIRRKIDLDTYVSDKVGMPTLRDIMAELEKPGRDPREQFEAFQFADGIKEIEDLKVGMTIPGIITNVTAFGAFVDVGVHQDGLVHISHLADRYIKDPNEVVKVQQKVKVKVLDVDPQRRRIALSMKTA